MNLSFTFTPLACLSAAAGRRLTECLVRFVFTALSAAFCLTLPSFAQGPPSPQAQPAASSDLKDAAKKVWTNENISSIQGTVSVVGGSGRSPRWTDSTSHGATFVNPKEGQIVHPGETIHIDLYIDSSITPIKGVGIISPMGFSNDFREGPPYSFAFTIPDKDLNGSSPHLIGFQQLTVFATVVGRNDHELATTTVDVEEDELPVSLSVGGNTMSQWDRIPNHLRFYTTGEDQWIAIYAKFSNGHEFDVTESTYLSLSSENPAVAAVSEDGTVTAVGAGETRIIAVYSLNDHQKLFYIPVTVHASSSEGIDFVT